MERYKLPPVAPDSLFHTMVFNLSNDDDDKR